MPTWHEQDDPPEPDEKIQHRVTSLWIILLVLTALGMIAAWCWSTPPRVGDPWEIDNLEQKNWN